jgi:4-aminobutyrate aminotransferase-like enzyme
MKLWKTGPQRTIVLVGGEGNYVYDNEGKRYLDLQSGYWCNVLGYSNPELVTPMQEQFSKLTNVMSAFHTEEINQAMEQLEKFLPSELNRASFLNSGSEAVDLGLKIACAATGKTGIVVNQMGYYGATAYTFALCSAGKNVNYLPALGEVYRLPPTCGSCEHGSSYGCKDWKCMELLQRLVDDGNNNIAAIIYEPVISAGIYIPAIGYGKQLKKYAEKLGALLISNEVTASPAKSGKWFAHQHDNVVPDILTLGKAIGGGFPVSVTITTNSVEEMCEGNLYHVQSHQNDALSGKAVATVISIIEKFGFVERCVEIGEYFLGKLKELKEDFPFIVEVRGRGLLLGIQLNEEYSVYGEEVQWKLIDKGYLMDFHKSSSSFRFFPPFLINKEEIEDFIEVFKETLSNLQAGVQVLCIRKP